MYAGTARAPLPAPSAGPPPQPELLNGVPVLTSRLVAEVARRSWLNAYLVAVGINQIAEDALHDDPFELRRSARYLDSGRRPLPVAAAVAARAVAGPSAAASRQRPSWRRVRDWQREFATLVELLAGLVAGPAGGAPDAEMRAATLTAELAVSAPRLDDEPLRIPACFARFDQRPADVRLLVQRFAHRFPDRRTPLLVVGVRTSGSYLAPLASAYLRSEGYADVRMLTVRPGSPLLQHERGTVRRATRDGARFAIVDDPPASGASVARVARELRRHGADHRRFVLLLPLLGSAEQVPIRLRDLDAIVLPAARWSVEAELTCAAVRSRMERFLGPDARVSSIERRPLHRRDERSHHRTLFRLHVRHGAAGKAEVHDVLVEGVGLGCFAEPAAAIAAALPEYVPHLYGVEDGLVYREWLPEHRRVRAEDGAVEDALADAVVSYALARRGRLPVERDATTYLSGGETVWEAASTTLARAFGRGWPFARRLALDRLVQAALRVDQPSVVDGHTGLSGWFLFGTERPIKADPFTPGPLACRDAAFDVAGAAASAPGSRLARRVRRSFERATGEEVEPSRWLLYQLVQIEQRLKACPEERRAATRLLAQALEGFFEELFFADLTPSANGPLCALDLDGVLETEVLGFPGLTPSAALAVRALTVHGYRPLIATGRSSGEVEERCRAYRLAGGVAEYGGAAFDARSHAHLALVSEAGQADLARLRVALLGLAAVEVDPDYRFAVRAWQTPGRRPLDAAVAAAAVSGAAVRVVQGDAQTDFVPAEVDKARAINALVTQLDGQPGPIAAAVGDTAVDLPMLAMAERRYAPAHAAALRAAPGVEILRRPYQAGLALAAAELLGHRPGGCDACRPRRHSRESALVLTVLGAQERGLHTMLRQAVRLRIESLR